MIVTKDPDASDTYTTGSTSSSAPLLSASYARSSEAADLPPSFESIEGPRVSTIDFSQEDTEWIQYAGGEGPPPEFSPYTAQHWLDGEGNVITHDPHLNEDGEALYRFLLSNTAEPPNFVVRCRGTHTETRTRTVHHSGHNHNGSGNSHHNGPHTKIETYTETVIDFNFRIDLTQHLMPPVLWTVADNEPAYRGRMVQEKETRDGIELIRRRTRRKENKEAERWKKFQFQNGYPPWAQRGAVEAAHQGLEMGVMRSSKTLRDWADEYCASDKMLKEFVFEKAVHGWNLDSLEKAIDSLIKSTYYTGNIKITFPVTGRRVYIRPTNWLSRALSHWWVKLILWILLIYPFIWLFKRFAHNGGGRWKVSGAAYPLKQWRHLPDSIQGEDVAQYLTRKEETFAREQSQRQLNVLSPSFPSDQKVPVGPSTSGDAWADRRPQTLAQFGATSTSSAVTGFSNTVPKISKLRQTTQGISELVGLREGEWFKQWEATLTRAVMLRVQRSDTITIPGETGARIAGIGLDGFED